jgi:hypothetical protein
MRICRYCDNRTNARTSASSHRLIAACGFQTVGQTSFTHAITKVLKTLAMEGKQFSVSELLPAVLAALRNTKGRADQTAPVHCTSTCDESGRHIMLEPLCILSGVQAPVSYPDPGEVINVSYGTTSDAPTSDDVALWRIGPLKRRDPPAESSYVVVRSVQASTIPIETSGCPYPRKPQLMENSTPKMFRPKRIPPIRDHLAGERSRRLRASSRKATLS